MTQAMDGKAARIEREQAKADREAAYQAKHARAIAFKRSKEQDRLSVEAWAARQNQKDGSARIASEQRSIPNHR